MARTFQDIGAFLKESREKAGIAPEQAAEQMGIRLKYLRDLESGNFGALPGKIYVEGYIRSYAKLLKVNGQELIKEYRESVKEGKHPEPERIKAERPDNELLPSRRTVLLSLLAMVVIYIGWYFVSYRDTVEHKQVVNERAAQKYYDSSIVLLATENTEVTIYKDDKPEPWDVVALDTGERYFVPYIINLKMHPKDEKSIAVFVGGEAIRSFDDIRTGDGLISLSQHRLEKIIEKDKAHANPIMEKLKGKKRATH